MKLRPADEEGRDDVVPVPVEVVPSPVVMRRRPGIGVSGGYLHVAEGDTSIQHRRDVRVAQGVWTDALRDASLLAGPTLTERRAEFVYEGARIAAVAACCPVIPEEWSLREEAFVAQFLDVIEKQMGPDRSDSPEELHGTWVEAYLAMGWQYGPERDPERKLHPDLVPYADLGQLERDKDAVFVALCEIARLWIYDGGPRG